MQPSSKYTVNSQLIKPIYGTKSNTAKLIRRLLTGIILLGVFGIPYRNYTYYHGPVVMVYYQDYPKISLICNTKYHPISELLTPGY